MGSVRGQVVRVEVAGVEKAKSMWLQTVGYLLGLYCIALSGTCPASALLEYEGTYLPRYVLLLSRDRGHATPGGHSEIRGSGVVWSSVGSPRPSSTISHQIEKDKSRTTQPENMPNLDPLCSHRVRKRMSLTVVPLSSSQICQNGKREPTVSGSSPDIALRVGLIH
jgi:hypothetical protein